MEGDWVGRIFVEGTSWKNSDIQTYTFYTKISSGCMIWLFFISKDFKKNQQKYFLAINFLTKPITGLHYL